MMDRTAVRFFSPETGGTAYPRFIFERVLAFEARFAEMAETPDGIVASYGERGLREAIEHHVAEEILASLADRFIAEAPPSKRPTPGDLASVERDVGFFRTTLPDYGAITTADVQAAARTVFQDDKAWRMVVKAEK